MHLRDTTIEANNKENMANYYLYHAESPANLYGLAVEQVEQDLYNVCVLYKEPDWDMYGVLRYWSFEDRAEAEARYLQLQTLFADVDEGISMKAIQRVLPEEERRGPRKED
jgi:hypothetical protein